MMESSNSEGARQEDNTSEQIVNKESRTMSDEVKIMKELMKEPAPWLDYRTPTAVGNEEKAISAAFAALPSTKERELENKTICGVVLSLKHGTSSKMKVFERSGFLNPYMVKRQKVAVSASYDRLLICGDVADKGNCFALLYQSSDHSRKMLYNISGGIGVGNIIYIGEPKKQDSTLGASLPIVISTWKVIPIVLPPTSKIESVLPKVPFAVPKDSGEHRYFVYHEQVIDLFGFRLVYEDVSCSGRFCDRANVRVTNVYCGCWQTGTSLNAVVGEYKVTLKIPTGAIDGLGDDETTIQDVRSLRTTEVFFDNLEDFATLENSEIERRTIEMREKIKAMTNYINAHGGWTVVGWFRKGDVVDASNEEAKVMADSVTLHISVLIPSTPVDAEFKKMRIKKIE